jgi:hypothetical protein
MAPERTSQALVDVFRVFKEAIVGGAERKGKCADGSDLTITAMYALGQNE